MNIIQSIPISKTLVYNNKPIYIILLDCRNDNTIEQINKIQIDMGLKMFAYHYFIDKKGKIFRGRPENAYAADIQALMNTDPENPLDTNFEFSNASNIISSNKLFICIEGNTELEAPTQNQYNSIILLCQDIVNRYRNLKNIYSLNELLPTYSNLGVYFDINTLRSEIFYTNIPVYSEGLNGNITYTFGERSLYYNNEVNFKGNDVKLLQLYLDAIGINVIKKNGIYDLFTYNAVKEFQKVFGLEVTGKMEAEDYNLLKSLIKNLNKKRNSYSYHRILYVPKDNSRITGNDVKFIQTKLNKLYYKENIEVNGIYDTNTENLVKKFQQDKELKVDGIIGPITFDRLINSILVEFTRILKYNENGFMYGDDVLFFQKQIKKSMKRFGITNISVTGYYDLITYNNIKKIQKLQLIPMTGEVDSVMWEFLKKL